MGDGDAVLRAVERSLETIFSLEVLEEVIREATELAAADSGPGAEIQRARDEMQRFAAADSLVVLTGLAVVGALYLEAVIVEGYELRPPAPPPAPHTPSPGVRPSIPSTDRSGSTRSEDSVTDRSSYRYMGIVRRRRPLIEESLAGNRVISDPMGEVAERVREGQPLATPLARTGVFPVMVTQMLSVGEETGAVDTMLHKLADFYDDEVATMLKSLTSIIEPMMMIGVGCIVGVVVISMYLPMFKIFELVQ